MDGGSVGRAVSRRLRALSARPTYLPGTEPVSLDELLSPLRYDVVVRADHFRFLEDRFDVFERDPDAYVRLAQGHPYFTWYTQVALPRYRPHASGDERRRLAAFRRRVLAAAQLWRSFKAVGFDARHPVTLRIAVPDAATATGKVVRRRVHVGDGCHRLAMLVAAGEPTLPPGWYQVRSDPQRSLIDNTSALIGPLGLGREEPAATVPARRPAGTRSFAASLRTHPSGWPSSGRCWPWTSRGWPRSRPGTPTVNLARTPTEPT